MMMMYPDKNDKKKKRKCSAWTPILEIAKNAVQIGSHHQDTCVRPVLEEMRLVHVQVLAASSPAGPVCRLCRIAVPFLLIANRCDSRAGRHSHRYIYQILAPALRYMYLTCISSVSAVIRFIAVCGWLAPGCSSCLWVRSGIF